MFGIMFLYRLLLLAVALILAGAILYGFAWLINRGVQVVASGLGYEVGDFFVWLRSVLPRQKKKSKKK